MRPFLLLSLLALGLPYLSAAQSATGPAAWRPRPFVGLGTSAGIYRSYSEYFRSSPSPELTAGLRLHPRLAIEVSATSARKEESNEYVSEPTFNDPTTNNAPVHAHVRTESNRHLVVVPLLLRFTPVAGPGRLHVDLLGGSTLARVRKRDSFVARNDAQVVFYSFYSEEELVEYYLDFGPSLRFEATPHLALLVNGLGQLSLSHPNPYGGNFSGAVSASIRYSFGRR